MDLYGIYAMILRSNNDTVTMAIWFQVFVGMLGHSKSVYGSR